MGYRDYSTAKGHIVDATGHGDFTTISAALSAAVSGQTIFVRPGTYTENPTLKAGVNISAFECDAFTPNVIINGECSFSAAGTVSISGIQLQTNNNFALAVTGSAASIVNLNDCFLNCLNNTGISFSSSSASANINFTNCNGNLATTGIAYFSHSSAGTLVFYKCNMSNTGSSTTTSTFSAGQLTISTCLFFFNTITSSGSTAFFSIMDSQINGGATTALIHNSTAALSTISFSVLASSTATALTIGAGATLLADFLTINTSNTTSASGSGVLKYGNLIYSGTTSNNQITTQTALPGTGWQLIQTLTASTSANLTFTNIGLFKIYAFVINNIIQATNAQKLELLASANNGSTFASTGYTAGLNYNSYNSITFTNVNSTTFAPMSSNVATGFGIQGTIFYDAVPGQYYGQMTYLSSDTSVQVNAQCVGATGVNTNAFRFQSSSGNLTSGSISIYGIAS